MCAGVSNFQLNELVELVDFSSIPPAVIQGHSDPFAQNLAVRRFASSLGIQFTAYSSLGTQHLRHTGGVNPVLENGAINAIGASLKSSAAQVDMTNTLICYPVMQLPLIPVLMQLHAGRAQIHTWNRPNHSPAQPQPRSHERNPECSLVAPTG